MQEIRGDPCEVFSHFEMLKVHRRKVKRDREFDSVDTGTGERWLGCRVVFKMDMRPCGPKHGVKCLLCTARPAEGTWINCHIESFFTSP